MVKLSKKTLQVLMVAIIFNVGCSNLAGQEIKNYNLQPIAGQGNLVIKGNELKPGMYVYSLVVDGQIIATKKMILTK